MRPKLTQSIILARRFGRRLKGFSVFVVKRFFDERLSDAATSLTFTTLLSLVPLLTVALALLPYFPAFAPLLDNMREFVILNLVPEAATRVLTEWVPRFAQSAGRMTLLGLLVLAVVALMLMATIETTFNAIWRVRKPRPLWRRALIYPVMLILGPMLIGSAISVSTYMLSAPDSLFRVLPELSLTIWWALPILLTATVLTLSYWQVPNRYVPFSHAIIGGLTAGVLLQILSHGLSIYLAYFSTYSLIYGAFASIPIFLLWLFAAWHIVIAGALIAASLSHWRGANWETRHMSGALLIDGLKILGALYRADGPLSLRELRREAPVAIEDLDCLLDQFRSKNWIKAERGRYSLCREVRLTLFDVYRLLVFDPAEIAALPDHEKALAAALKQSESLHAGSLAQPLATLFNRTD